MNIYTFVMQDEHFHGVSFVIAKSLLEAIEYGDSLAEKPLVEVLAENLHSRQCSPEALFLHKARYYRWTDEGKEQKRPYWLLLEEEEFRSDFTCGVGMQCCEKTENNRLIEWVYRPAWYE